MHDADKTSMATLARVFPGAGAMKKADDEQISLVNEGIVEEVLLPLGQLDFGKGWWASATSACGALAASTSNWSENSLSRCSSRSAKTWPKSKRSWPHSSTSSCRTK